MKKVAGNRPEALDDVIAAIGETTHERDRVLLLKAALRTIEVTLRNTADAIRKLCSAVGS